MDQVPTSSRAPPASVEICTLLRKPEAAKVEIDVRYVGFDIPNEFVVGYGLDYAEQYRNLPCRRHAGAARLLLTDHRPATVGGTQRHGAGRLTAEKSPLPPAGVPFSGTVTSTSRRCGCHG